MKGSRALAVLAVLACVLGAVLATEAEEEAQYLPDYDSPIFPDYSNPNILTIKQFFGQLVNPPIDGDCNCGQCRAMIGLRFDAENCAAAYKYRRRFESPDMAQRECSAFEAQFLQQLPALHHMASWYLCSCLGCCDGDCFFKRRFKGPDPSWTKESPVQPIAACKPKSEEDQWTWDRCVGVRSNARGWMRTLRLEDRSDACTGTTLTEEERFNCEWVHTAIENQVDSKLDRYDRSRILHHGLADYASYYLCSCLGCSTPSVECLWHGPQFHASKSPYTIAYRTGEQKPLVADAGSGEVDPAALEARTRQERAALVEEQRHQMEKA